MSPREHGAARLGVEVQQITVKDLDEQLDLRIAQLPDIEI
jgi:hypothetical protein